MATFRHCFFFGGTFSWSGCFRGEIKESCVSLFFEPSSILSELIPSTTFLPSHILLLLQPTHSLYTHPHTLYLLSLSLETYIPSHHLVDSRPSHSFCIRKTISTYPHTRDSALRTLFPKTTYETSRSQRSFTNKTKMFAKIFLAVAAAQASLAAAGNAIVSNRCNYDIWVWSVDQDSFSSAIHVPARSQYSEPLRSSCNGCGTSLKVSKTNQLVGGAQTQFEYSVVNNQLWYDISFVDCAQGESASSCPGHDFGLAMDSPESACGKINCAGGSYCPSQAYYVDFPQPKLGMADPVFACPGAGMGMDLYMKVCSDEAPMKRSIAGRLAIDLD